ncbi:MAG: glutamate-1-semialdehyde 2,1-aminomutase [Nitrososphaerales archaeon]
MSKPNSQFLYEKAKELMPGGVNSPVRAYDPYPFFTSYAKGSKIYDVDGKSYIDYCMAYGSLILGHAHPDVIEAVESQLKKGSVYGTPIEAEVELAELIRRTVPCIEMIRLVNTGTEASMHAIRVARGYTKRKKIIKFEGCYHGAHDSVLVKASSKDKSGAPASLGVLDELAKNTIVLPYNNIEALERSIIKNEDEIAAVIIEPVMGNSGVILPRGGYLQALRSLTKEHSIVLIFDEVITGFRLSLGGAQEYYNVTADMVLLGKIIGGGFPMAAFGGRKEMMSLLAPLGEVYQAGTFSGNPISVVAGLTTLKILIKESNKIYRRLDLMGDKMRNGIINIIKDKHLPYHVNGLSSMFQLFFTKKKVVDNKIAKSSDMVKFKLYHRRLLEDGIFIPPSQFETCFLSNAHEDEDIEKTLESIEKAMDAQKR